MSCTGSLSAAGMAYDKNNGYSLLYTQYKLMIYVILIGSL